MKIKILLSTILLSAAIFIFCAQPYGAENVRQQNQQVEQTRKLDSRVGKLEDKIDLNYNYTKNYVDIVTTNVNWALGILTLLVGAAGIFSFNKFDGIKKDIEKTQTNINELKTQMDSIRKNVADIFGDVKNVKEKIDVELNKIKLIRHEQEEILRSTQVSVVDSKKQQQFIADQVLKGKDAQTVLLASGIKALEDKKFSSAIAFFDTCLKESPEDPVVNYYAGSARTQQAIGIEATDDKERLLNEAECYFKKAVDLKPDLAAAWNDWGKLLQNRSELCDSVYEREKLLDSAAQKYRKALSCDTNNYSSLYNLAVLLALQAGNAIALEQKDQALKYWQEADEIYTRASQIEIHHGALWFSWMLMLTEWGKQVADPNQKEKLARKQEEVTDKGLRYTPDYFEKILGLPPQK